MRLIIRRVPLFLVVVLSLVPASRSRNAVADVPAAHAGAVAPIAGPLVCHCTSSVATIPCADCNGELKVDRCHVHDLACKQSAWVKGYNPALFFCTTGMMAPPAPPMPPMPPMPGVSQ